MKKGLKTALIIVGVLLLLGLLIASPYNKLVRLDEGVKNAWAQVENQLQRRMDLIPNLVKTVEGYASFERATLEAVINARAKATSTQINAGDMNPAQLQQYMEAQNGLTSALGRLMVVVEKYPELKANENFLRLQDELAGTENRIAVERKRYNDNVQVYNQSVRKFPVVLIAGLLGFDQKPYFQAPAEASTAPTVDFSGLNK
ncbi:MAG TPA: LemA family protein [bacterium]|nr:LemA family protein [bacterium]